MASPIGRRIHVLGGTSAGKSTLANQLAESIGVSFVELDALNWMPDWVGLNETDPTEFDRRIRAATAGDEWVVAGGYSAFSEAAFWDRLETVIWLDLPLHLTVRRVLTRSWKRWRSQELLWGTNRERFFPHFAVWSRDSLIYWAVTSHRRRRRNMIAKAADPRWAHIRFIRLTSVPEVNEFRRLIEVACTLAPEPRSVTEPTPIGERT